VLANHEGRIVVLFFLGDPMEQLAAYEEALDTHECQTVALAAHPEQLVALTGLQEDQAVA